MHSIKTATGKTTSFEAFWNICNTIQGLPILSIAYVIHCGGFVSLISLFVVASTSCYTSFLIVSCMYICDPEGHVVRVRGSFAEIGNAVWVKRGATLVLITQFVQLILICSLYPFIVGSVIHTLFCQSGISQNVWILVSSLPFLINAFITNLSQVAWTSAVVIISAGIIFTSVLVHCFVHVHSWNWSVLFSLNQDKFPVAIMWLMSSYFSQPFVAVIEATMLQKRRFFPILVLSFIAMTLVNICMGLIAAAAFYPDTSEVITNNLPSGPFKISIASITAVLAFASFTLPMFTVFEILQQFYGVYEDPASVKQDFHDLPLRQIILRCLLTALTVFLAATPNFPKVVAFFSCVTGTALELIFPAVFHIKLCYSRMTSWQFVLDVLILLFGVVMLACGVYFSGRSLVLGTENQVSPHLHPCTQQKSTKVY